MVEVPIVVNYMIIVVLLLLFWPLPLIASGVRRQTRAQI